MFASYKPLLHHIRKDKWRSWILPGWVSRGAVSFQELVLTMMWTAVGTCHSQAAPECSRALDRGMCPQISSGRRPPVDWSVGQHPPVLCLTPPPCHRWFLKGAVVPLHPSDVCKAFSSVQWHIDSLHFLIWNDKLLSVLRSFSTLSGWKGSMNCPDLSGPVCSQQSKSEMSHFV